MHSGGYWPTTRTHTKKQRRKYIKLVAKGSSAFGPQHQHHHSTEQFVFFFANNNNAYIRIIIFFLRSYFFASMECRVILPSPFASIVIFILCCAGPSHYAHTHTRIWGTRISLTQHENDHDQPYTFIHQPFRIGEIHVRGENSIDYDWQRKFLHCNHYGCGWLDYMSNLNRLSMLVYKIFMSFGFGTRLGRR